MKFHLKKNLFSFFISLLLPALCHAGGPIVVDDNFVQTNGNVITGNYVGTLTQPAITITTTKPITIVNASVQGPGDLIYGVNSDLVVINTTALGTNPNQVGVRKGRFVHIEQAINVLVANCTITSVGYPIYINRYVGNKTSQQTIRIYGNNFVNVDGRPSDGNGGYQTSGNGKTHAILLNAQYSVPYIEIAWNQIINQPYASDVNDNINMYDSSGTSASHIAIHDNYIQGAYSITPGSSESYSGGGIIIDGSSSDTTTTAPAFIDIYNNQVVSTSNYGVSIAGGHDNQIFNNRIVSSGFLSNGVFHAMKFGNGVNNFNNYSQPSNIFFNNYTSNNYSGLIRPDSSNKPMRSDWYLPGQVDSGNNIHFSPNVNTSPTIADEQTELQTWKKKSGYFGMIGRLSHDIDRATVEKIRRDVVHYRKYFK